MNPGYCYADVSHCKFLNPGLMFLFAYTADYQVLQFTCFVLLENISPQTPKVLFLQYEMFP